MIVFLIFCVALLRCYVAFVLSTDRGINREKNTGIAGYIQKGKEESFFLSRCTLLDACVFYVNRKL